MAIFLLSNEAQTDFTNENIITGGVWVALATCLFLISVFAEADARSRFQEFRRVRALLCRYGWNRRIIKAISHSRCQRDAIRLAAEEAGYPSEIGQFYQELGYRWFHLIPDLVLENPRNFFTRRFLRSSFFVKRFQEYRGEKTPPVLWQCADETP